MKKSEEMESFEMDDFEGDSLTRSPKKQSTTSFKDPMTEKIMGIYKTLNLDDSEILKFALMIMPIVLIFGFYQFVSKSTSTIISFSAFVVSITFLFVAFIMLCEILKKDVGPKKMQDIPELIREGSEGFFIT